MSKITPTTGYAGAGDGSARAAGWRPSPSEHDIAAIAVALVGEPNSSLGSPEELRFRSHGSLSINIRKGLFYDFEAGVGGGPLQLVIHLGAADTVEAARAWLEGRSLPLRSNPEPVKSHRQRSRDAGGQVNALWASGVSILGTPAEKYLLNRRINPSLTAALRYVAKAFNVEVGYSLPAMLSPVTRLDAPATLLGVQRTWLTLDGSKASLSAPRKLLGSLSGGGVVLSPLETTMLVGEGVETTLSASALLGTPGIATLGAANMARLATPPMVEAVLIAFDRDANGVGLAAANRLALRLRSQGKRVDLVEPPVGHKDFNSAAQAAG